MHDFDVVVVGGGCAGLWAARTAGLCGARTLLVERRGRFGEKIACAEGIGTARIRKIIEVQPECVAAAIDGGRLFDPEGGCVEIDEPGCGYILNKEVFLRSLAVMAVQSGVETWVGTEARMVRPVAGGGLMIDLEGVGGRFTVTAGAVVAADGIESRIGRLLGIQRALAPNELFSCAQYTLAAIDVDPRRVEFHFGRDIAPGGYAWVFPKGEGIANVGVGMICTGKSEAPPLTYLERFKQRRCAEARPLARVFGGVPAARAPFRVCGRGVFLAGDAGRVADPVSGAGIVPSMESGELAARAAVDHSRGGSTKGAVERKFTAGMKARFKDRSMRFAVRKILSRLSDDELVKMLGLLGEYASRGSILAGDPIGMVKFMLKAMPQTFGVVRHLVRG